MTDWSWVPQAVINLLLIGTCFRLKWRIERLETGGADGVSSDAEPDMPIR